MNNSVSNIFRPRNWSFQIHSEKPKSHSENSQKLPHTWRERRPKFQRWIAFIEFFIALSLLSKNVQELGILPTGNTGQVTWGIPQINIRYATSERENENVEIFGKRLNLSKGCLG